MAQLSDYIYTSIHSMKNIIGQNVVYDFLDWYGFTHAYCVDWAFLLDRKWLHLKKEWRVETQNSGCTGPSTSAKIPSSKDNLHFEKIGPVANDKDVIFWLEMWAVKLIEKKKYHEQWLVCLYQEVLPLNAIPLLLKLVYVSFMDDLHLRNAPHSQRLRCKLANSWQFCTRLFSVSVPLSIQQWCSPSISSYTLSIFIAFLWISWAINIVVRI